MTQLKKMWGRCKQELELKLVFGNSITELTLLLCKVILFPDLDCQDGNENCVGSAAAASSLLPLLLRQVSSCVLDDPEARCGLLDP